MFKPRIIIRELRHASLILIALPEPFTTAIGVVLLGVTFYLAHVFSNVIDKSLNIQAREKLTAYLAHLRHFGNDDVVAVPVEADERQPEPIRVRKTDDGELKADLRSSILLGDHSSSSHHAIDHKSLAKRYGLVDDSPAKPAESDFEAVPVKPGKKLYAKAALVSASNFRSANSPETDSENSIRHAINREGLYRRYSQQETIVPAMSEGGFVQAKKTVGKTAKASLTSQLGEQNNEPSKHHAVNMKYLQKRYSPAGRSSPPKVYREGFDLLNVFTSF